MSERGRFAAALVAGALLSWSWPAHADGAHEIETRLASGAVLRVSMPLAGWNGALVEVRCGAECPAPAGGLCANIVARGYACFAGAPTHDLHDSAHARAMLLAAKAVVSEHFSKAPEISVLLACGRSAGAGLWQAEKYVEDFQGIVAGAPILDDDAHRHRLRWLRTTLRSARGAPLLTQADLARLHEQALANCDANDGLADGLISDPLRCNVQAEALQCAVGRDRGNRADCLRPAQVAAIRRVYAGPAADPATGLTPGSELEWNSLQASAGRGNTSTTPAPAASRSARGDHAQPDLHRFVAAGGKLLLFQGLADVQAAPRASAQTYERWAMALGGRVKSTGAVRLFMVPGMQHCGGGSGPHRVDFLRGVENWVMHAKRAPDDLIAFRPRSDQGWTGNVFAPTAADPAQQVFSSWQVGVAVTLADARNQAQTRFSRPIYLYPVHTHYKGMGDPDLWRSFYGPSDYPWLLAEPR